MSNMMSAASAGRYPEPSAPYPNRLYYAHEHQLSRLGVVIENPSGTYSSLWSCASCPDIFIGGKTGPIPPGACSCGWVQKRWPRKRCEECSRPMLPNETDPA